MSVKLAMLLPLIQTTLFNDQSTQVKPPLKYTPFKGSAIATVKSTDKIKVFTVRNTAFEPAKLDGGSGIVEAGVFVKNGGRSCKWVDEKLAKGDRPELGGAKIVIGGGRGNILITMHNYNR